MSLNEGRFERIDQLQIHHRIPDEIVKFAPRAVPEAKMFADIDMLELQEKFIAERGNENIMFGVPKWGKDNGFGVGEHWVLSVDVYEQREG